jgi:hypothetical protein
MAVTEKYDSQAVYVIAHRASVHGVLFVAGDPAPKDWPAHLVKALLRRHILKVAVAAPAPR